MKVKYINITGLKLTVLMLLCFTMFSFLAACGGSETTTDPNKLKKGVYSYQVMDSAKSTLVDGQMKITAITSDPITKMYIVTGTYTIANKTQDTNYVAFGTMDGGEFKGYYDKTRKSININTNPKIADANVFIDAAVNGATIDGGWYFSTFRGKDKEGGYFKATWLSSK